MVASGLLARPGVTGGACYWLAEGSAAEAERVPRVRHSPGRDPGLTMTSYGSAYGKSFCCFNLYEEEKFLDTVLC